MVHVNGPFAEPIRRAIGEAWIADSYEHAQEASRLTPLPVVTVDGAVFRGPQLVSGGSRDDARGILETKREIKELRARIRVRAGRAVAGSPKRPPRSRAPSRPPRTPSPR